MLPLMVWRVTDGMSERNLAVLDGTLPERVCVVRRVDIQVLLHVLL